MGGWVGWEKASKPMRSIVCEEKVWCWGVLFFFLLVVFKRFPLFLVGLLARLCGCSALEFACLLLASLFYEWNAAAACSLRRGGWVGGWDTAAAAEGTGAPQRACFKTQKMRGLHTSLNAHR